MSILHGAGLASKAMRPSNGLGLDSSGIRHVITGETMSSEFMRDKKRARIDRDGRAQSRQLRIAKAHIPPMTSDKEFPDIMEPHRLEKRHAMTCGNSNCVMCGNPRKFFGERTIQERKLFQPELQEDDVSVVRNQTAQDHWIIDNE